MHYFVFIIITHSIKHFYNNSPNYIFIINYIFSSLFIVCDIHDLIFAMHILTYAKLFTVYIVTLVFQERERKINTKYMCCMHNVTLADWCLRFTSGF